MAQVIPLATQGKARPESSSKAEFCTAVHCGPGTHNSLLFFLLKTLDSGEFDVAIRCKLLADYVHVLCSLANRCQKDDVVCISDNPHPHASQVAADPLFLTS